MQIPAYNEFRFIGTCYSDATRRYEPNGKVRCHITLCVKSPNKTQNNHIPIIAFDDLAERASVLCRNGARVCVSGYICTQEIVDRVTAEIKIRTYFYAMDIMRISKPKRKNITYKKFTDLVELASIEDYRPLKPRTK